ncbi:MAG TPA: sigma-54 dependent transcriptional regulator [Pyrinomonadaceae bacterium]
MKPAKILLLDLNPTASSSSTLRGIFDARPVRDDIQLTQEIIRGGEGGKVPAELSRLISSNRPDVIFLVPPAGAHGERGELFRSLECECQATPVVVVSETGGADEMFEWLRLGAADFITAPLRADDVLPRVRQLLEQDSGRDGQAQALKGQLGTRLLIGESPAFLKEVGKIPLLSKCGASVLISGETGTGKEVCARAIHYLSPRAKKPFIPVNCGAIPIDLVENELFGHERGAFTGAKDSQVGLIQEADGGTLFLDEVDCLPLLAQVKLLRFLQEKEYRPLGSAKTCRADVRVVAATNCDPEAAVKAGKLRQDLYYRLNVIPLVLPPLRDRREDIPLLARHFLARYAAEYDKPVTDFSAETVRRLVSYDWPGNVRELEHVVVRAVVLCTQTRIRDEDIFLPMRAAAAAEESFQGAKNRIIAEFEKSYIERALLMNHGNISRAARAAQKSRRAFWELIRKHQIDVKTLKLHAS